ncbi:chromosome partitioning protein : ParBc, ParB-like nuclease domain OS=Symbiobacterium thermophilum (strain T / IAM 14863) GN=STH3332 PE=4 SV=1: ParBc [Gemmata massiliana]|uniref:ParB-like N-terminal domain-containing protein n=1 Tax=Gemmata massiliana TaxID=1210884 RepID=A0A6P2CVD1_9BACT|nr:ParB/RepB/Spo0J family partition protein [Gemmata massiliana]VTR91674.1 chromosome partitioning protein : ParBc, ParB-like nuclease domain OS=Symbiobacterium thermophilum (strain T / IAM 14863) GN=STH3332 PE=4 SV=1: ParBc [Gemmata massiliana]
MSPTNETAPPLAPAPISAPAQSVVPVAVDLIDLNPHNPRKTFDELELVAFGMELKRHQIKQPLRVARKPDGRYELVGGERRLRAAKLVGIEHVPCLVLPRALSPAEVILDQLQENTGVHLTPLEKAEAYQQLMRLNRWNQSELAAHLPGVTETDISKVFTIKANLAPQLREHVRTGKLGAAVAYDLARVRDTARQLELGEKVVTGALSRAELALVIKQGAKPGTRRAKAVRVAVRFDLGAGFEALEQKLGAMLADVARLKKNALPADLLAGMWAAR